VITIVIVTADVRNRRGRDREDHDVLVHHLVVAEIVGERRRCSARLRGHEYGGTGDPDGRRRDDNRHEVLDRNRARGKPFRHDAASRFPCGHDGEHAAADEERQPSALQDLDEVRAEEHQIDCQK